MGIPQRIQLAATVGGLGISGTVVQETDGAITQQADLPKAETGTLTTRTSDSEGEITLATGHVITTAMVVDVYWLAPTSGGGMGGVRYGMTVGTVAGDVAPVTGGEGDNLPPEDAALTVSPQQAIQLDLDGDDLQIMMISATRRTHLDFRTSSASALAFEFTGGEAWQWVTGRGFANPVAGSVIQSVMVSNGDAVKTSTLRIGIGYDSIG